MAVIDWWNGPLTLVVIFFALCLLLLTWSIACVACRACHSSGTPFFHCDTHTHTHTHTYTQTHTHTLRYSPIPRIHRDWQIHCKTSQETWLASTPSASQHATIRNSRAQVPRTKKTTGFLATNNPRRDLSGGWNSLVEVKKKRLNCINWQHQAWAEDLH